MKELTIENFDKTLNDNELVLIDWFSEVCFQCEALRPKLEKLESKYSNIRFCSANVGNLSDIATRYGIMALPTILLFKNNKVVHQFCGNLPQDVFEKELNKI